MNKRKFRHRLLSIVLAMVMIVGMLPTSGLVTAKAATENTTVYFDTSGNSAASWDSNAQIYVYGFTGSDNTGIKSMEKVTANIYKYTFSKQYKNVIFLNNSSWPKDKSGQTVTLTVPWSTYANPVFKLNGYYNEGVGDKKGDWSEYATGGGTTASDTFYVDVDLVDYYNDARVESGDTSVFGTGNQGNLLGDRAESTMGGGLAFSYLNGRISQYYENTNSSIPLYFGALLFSNNRAGRIARGGSQYLSLTRWNSTANVALTVNNQIDGNTGTATHNTTASVQGLVKDTLGTNGELYGIDGTELPFFSKEMAKNWHPQYNTPNSLMKYYEDYEFPFKVESIEGSNIKKYSYDSATDYSVSFDSSNTNNKKLVKSDTKTLNVDNTPGYYPFNTPGESTRSNINYGFGTKFTIPFTINKNGTIEGTEDGTPITFEFTGDDDVWVFIDNKLVLDMGGAHGKAEGVINFKDLTATAKNAAVASTDSSQMISSGNSYEASSYQNKGLTNYFWDDTFDQERSAVATKAKTLSFATAYGEKFANDFKDPSKSHTLVMYYMERGMYDSNMKVEFTINPLPSGLSLSKSLDVTNVNTALKEAVQIADNDNFAFEIQTKDLKTEGSTYAAVSNLGYSLNNYNNQDTAGYKAANGVVTGVGARSFAHSFINTESGADAFVAGTGFKITERDNTDTVLKYDYTKTTWTVYNKKNNYSVVTSSAQVTGSDPLVAVFDMGSSKSEATDTFDYDVNFRNTPKVGSLTVEKEWDSNQTAPTDGTYSFTVKIKLGDGEYVAYPLDGDLVDADANGTFSLASGQKVTFSGIPQGASYQVIENIPEGAGYASDKGNNMVEGTIPIPEDASTVASVTETFTNKFEPKTVDKVIYVDADGSNLSYTVKDPADNKEINIKEVTAVEGITVTENDTSTIVINTSNSNTEYKIPYTGSKADGTYVSGTITVYTFSAVDKVYVFDYGLNSDLAATNDKNDGLFQGSVFYNEAAEKTTEYNTTAKYAGLSANENNTETTISEDTKGSLINESGDLVDANGVHKEVLFTPIKFMTKVENYTYEVEIAKANGSGLDKANPETGTAVDGSIKVMPANVVYYEDNFVDISYGTDGTINKSTATTSKQANESVSVHGNDIIYNGSNTDSDGSYTTLERTEKTDTDTGVPTFSFTFNGTGFDIVGRTSKDSAKLTIVVEDANGNVVKTGVVDTYYANGNLYQIPVISIKDLENAKYTVKVAVVKSAQGGSVFYLDGIRIYNPMSDTSAYPDEAEKNVVFANIHQLLVGDGTISEDRYDDGTILSVTADNSKMVLVSYDASVKKAVLYGKTNTEDFGNNNPTYSASLVDYLNKGPNNEVYIDPNVGIAFDVTGNVKTIQVEAKQIGITTEENATTNAENTFSIMGSDGELTPLDKVQSKTAMYYNIPVSSCIETDDGYRVILIAHDTVSISNIKYTSDCTIKVPNATDYLTRPKVDPDDDGYAYQAQITNISFSPSAKALQSGKQVKITVTLDDETNFDHFNVYMVHDSESVNTEAVPNIALTRDSADSLTYVFYAPKVKGKYNFVIVPVDKGGNKSAYQKSVAVKVK